MHAALEKGIFAGGGLAVETEHLLGSAFLAGPVRTGGCTIGHVVADELVCDAENLQVPTCSRSWDAAAVSIPQI